MTVKGVITYEIVWQPKKEICDTIEEENLQSRQIQVAQNQPILSAGSAKISNQPNYTSALLQACHEGSQCLSGNISSRARLSTLTKSSHLSIACQLIHRERLTLETLKSVLKELKWKGKLKWVLSGLLHGDPLHKQLLWLSTTKRGSWPNMETTLNDSLLPSD